jgi:hypothetical protein
MTLVNVLQRVVGSKVAFFRRRGTFLCGPSVWLQVRKIHPGRLSDGTGLKTSRSLEGSITSWSITTDVSTSPRVGSVIEALVDYHIKIRSEAARIDLRCSRRCFSQGGRGHEPTRPNGLKLCHSLGLSALGSS